MKDFDYIHFTCHGLLNDDFQSPVLSQLPPDKSKEDGYFTLNEIMNCDYNAKLVVLSACQTGSGKLERAEALRQAKLELIKNKEYRSPLFWSAFVMYGE